MHVYITGASSGIGEAITREYVRRGASVTMVARRKSLLEKIASEVGGKTHVIEQDLSDVEHVTDKIAEAEDKLGGLDVMVSIVGAAAWGSLLDTTAEIWDQQMSLNLRYFFLTLLGRKLQPFVMFGNLTIHEYKTLTSV